MSLILLLPPPSFSMPTVTAHCLLTNLGLRGHQANRSSITPHSPPFPSRATFCAVTCFVAHIIFCFCLEEEQCFILEGKGCAKKDPVAGVASSLCLLSSLGQTPVLKFSAGPSVFVWLAYTGSYKSCLESVK